MTVKLVRALGAVEEVTVRLAASPVIAGLALDSRGDGISGAIVETVSSGPHSEARTTSGAGGVFELPIPVGVTGRIVIAAKPPREREDLYRVEQTIEGPRRDVRGVHLTLIDARTIGCSLSGIVTDSAGFGVERIEAVPADSKRSRSSGSAKVDATGHFEVFALEPGRYVVEALAKEEVVAAQEIALVKERPGTCNLTTRRATLRVRVIDGASEKPLPLRVVHVAVRSRSSWAQAEDEGRLTNSKGELVVEIAAGLKHCVDLGDDEANSKAHEECTADAGETREVILRVDPKK